MPESDYPSRPHIHFNLPDGNILRVAELTPSPHNQTALTVYTDGVAGVMHDSWTAKFVDTGILEPHERDNVLKNPYQQRKAINDTYVENETAAKLRRASKAARYFVTSAADGYEAPAAPDDIRAVLRVEPYRPKRPAPGNLLRRPYPKVTDIETRSGKLVDGEYRLDALVLMRTALSQVHPARKVAAYTERENPDGIDFFSSLCFYDRLRDQASTVGSRPGEDGGPAVPKAIHYVHMETRTAGVLQDLLRRITNRHLAD